MKIAVVTGAGGVLCSAFAKALAEDGYAIALLDINEAAVKAVAEDIVAQGGKAIGYGVSVLDREALEATHKQILADLGPCDVLINGATDMLNAMFYADNQASFGGLRDKPLD